MSRPITYDREAVVEMAALQFWEDGFGDCNVESLTQRAKLNRHSLYKSFGGKKGLFLDALKFYIARIAAPYLKILEDGSALDDLIRYFATIANVLSAPETRDTEGFDRRGCLITNIVTELGHADPEIGALVDRYYARHEKAFSDLVMRAQAGGTIRAGLDARAIGRWLLLTSQGISVAARLGQAGADIPGILRDTLAPAPRLS